MYPSHYQPRQPQPQVPQPYPYPGSEPPRYGYRFPVDHEDDDHNLQSL